MQQNSNKALYFLLITVMIDAIGLGIIIPVMPNLISEVGSISLTEASKHNGWLVSIYAFMQFMFAPILGGLSDRYGRRPVILLALFGLGINYVFFAFAPSLLWLYVGRALSGICGSSFTVANAYIADISNPEDRTQKFGMIAAAFGMGFIIGPAIGGIVSIMGIRTPFYLASALSIINVIYGIFVLKESLPQSKRRSFDFSRANPFGAFIFLKRKPLFKWFFLAFFLFYFAEISLHSTWNFFTMQRYDWSPSAIGWSLVAVGIAIAIVQGALIGKFTKKWGIRKSILIGVIFTIIGFLGFAISSKGWMLYIWMLPYALGGFVEPSVKSLLTTMTAENEQGELQGAFVSLMSLASILSPLLMTGIYYHTTKNWSPPLFGSPYYLAVFLLILSIPLVFIGFKKVKTKM